MERMKHIKTYESFLNESNDDAIFEDEFKKLPKQDVDAFVKLIGGDRYASLVKSINYAVNQKSFNVLGPNRMSYPLMTVLRNEVRNNFDAVLAMIKKKYPDVKRVWLEGHNIYDVATGKWSYDN
jgi:hypothetical protein